MLSKNKVICNLIIINLVLLVIFLLTKVKFILTPLVSLKNAVLIPFILAVFLYYILRPINRFLKNKKVPNTLATLITILVVFFLLMFMITYASSTLSDEGSNLISILTESITRLSDKYSYLYPKLNEYLNLEGIFSNILHFFKTSFVDLSVGAFTVVGSLGNFFAQLILIPIIMFYILKDEYKIYNAFIKIIPTKFKKFIVKLFKDIDRVLRQYISAQIMVALVIGVLMFIGYLIIRMPNALVLSFFAFITSFIPFLGPILGILPALIIALSMGFSMLVKIVILAIVVQQLEGNVITPNITGNQLNMYPLTTIIVITASVYFGGFFAAFLAVPVYNIIKVTILNIYDFYKETKKKKITEV